MLERIKSDLQRLADPEKARVLSRFFKTGKGEYGEGDMFLGITVPEQRKIAREYCTLSLKELQKLLGSKIHEHRLTALLILVIKYQKAEANDKEAIYGFYLKNLRRVNNWDLVDLSADKILGDYLYIKDRSVLYELALSCNVWERRTALLATFHFIKNNEFEETLKICGMLLNDDHALIHKAAGWMLREIGKRDIEAEERFLRKYHGKMPRTMLRYAVERFNEEKRKMYLKK